MQADRPLEALYLFDEMLARGNILPDDVALVTAITACVRLGRLGQARSLFAGVASSSSSNCVAWNALISGHAQNGHELEALEFFRDMRRSEVEPTRSTIGSVLSATASLAALEEGTQLQSLALRLGLASNVYVGSSLISFYAKCGAVEEARMVFDSLPEKNTVTWNALLGGYSQNGMVVASVELFKEMNQTCSRDEYTYVSLFSAVGSWDLGRQLHGHAIKTGHDGSSFAGNSLIDMYSKLGDLGDANRQFLLLPRRDVVSWNSLMAGQVHNGCEFEALLSFVSMRSHEGGGVTPDTVSLSTVISASEGRLRVGEQAHCLAVKLGLESSSCVGISLIDFYGKLGDMDSATRAFGLISEIVDNEVPFNALIAGYVQNGDGEAAAICFQRLLRQGIKPSAFTFASIFPSVQGLGTQQLHSQAMKLGFLRSREAFLDVILVVAYLRCRRQGDAMGFLAEVPGSERSLVLWTAAISGHAQGGYSEAAISLFWEMVGHGMLPDESAFASVIGACADLASSWRGRTVHGLLLKMGYPGGNEFAGSALVDMYGKCGEIESAVRAFEEMECKRDVTLWNAMIAGLGRNGRAKEALAMFRRMQQEGRPPDEVTYLAALTACSHGGMVAEGRQVFKSMKERGVEPRVDHLGCLVDLLGRGGHLEEAEAVVTGGMQMDAVAWGTVAAASRVHGDRERGGRAAGEAMKMEPEASAPYLMVLRMCGERGDWEGAKRVREAMREKGVRKREAGCSWISAPGGETSAFVARDEFHPRAGEIYSALRGLGSVMRAKEEIAEYPCDETACA